MNGLTTPDILTVSATPVLDSIISKVGDSPFLQGLKRHPSLEKYLQFNFSEVQEDAFTSLPIYHWESKVERAEIDDLGAECLAWAALAEMKGNVLAKGILPQEYKDQPALVDFFSKKIQSRSREMLKGYIQLEEVLRSRAQNGVLRDSNDIKLFQFMRRGVRSHKALVASLYLAHELDTPISDRYVIPLGVFREDRKKGLFQESTQAFSCFRP